MKWGWKLGLSRKGTLAYLIRRGDSVESRGVRLGEAMLIGLKGSARVVVDAVETERVRSESQLMLWGDLGVGGSFSILMVEVSTRCNV